MAYVVPGDGVSREEVSPAALSAFCARQLARFKVPRYWKYRDDLPRISSERVRKEALREEHEAPRTGTYDRVDGLWRCSSATDCAVPAAGRSRSDTRYASRI